MVGSAEGDWSTLWVLPEWLQNACSRKTAIAEAVKEIFKGTGTTISTYEERCLGEAIGTTSFLCQYVERKVKSWVNEVENLSKVAESQPHAAYAAFTHSPPQSGTTF